MNFNPGFSENSFESTGAEKRIEMLLPSLAYNSVIDTILEGSGGPDNTEMTETGLRFVRYLLSTSKSARHGFVPNFKDMDAITEVARDFIRRCGGPSMALKTLVSITAGEAA